MIFLCRNPLNFQVINHRFCITIGNKQCQSYLLSAWRLPTLVLVICLEWQWENVTWSLDSVANMNENPKHYAEV